jgi:hypothetical protein
LPTAPSNYKHAAITVKYFTKWVEEKPLWDITAGALQKFFWQNIVCHFGKQFDCATFMTFCE